jgi:hypothetical protein
MVRNVDINKNPYPSDHFELKGENIYIPSTLRESKQSKAKEIMYGICNYKKKTRK